jgi:phosphatidylinositol alpha-1,6-mannosyltransferase
MPALPDRAHYLLAGEGETAALVESVAARLGLAHRVHQLGRVPHAKLESLYHGADLFVMPNRRVEGDMEGFGVVMLEASLCGLPVLGVRLEGIRDAVTEGKNGWLVEAERPEEMASAISSLIGQPEVLRKMSSETRVFAIEHFSWDGVASQMCHLLGKLCRERASDMTA